MENGGRGKEGEINGRVREGGRESVQNGGGGGGEGGGGGRRGRREEK